MTSLPPPSPAIELIGGVDAHKHTHYAAAVDDQGRLLGHREFPADDNGYKALLRWLRAQGHIILGTGSDRGDTAVNLVDLIARHALGSGFDVVVEGILDAACYGDMLAALRADHRGLTGAYLYVLPFEETMRRHAAKGETAFGEAEMRSWWHGFQPVTGLQEKQIDAAQSLARTTRRILGDMWSGS